MSEIDVKIKVSELEEFQSLIESLLQNYVSLPVDVRHALNDLVNCDDQPNTKDCYAKFANPKGDLDLYLKKEGGVVFPCDKNGKKVSHLVSGSLDQHHDAITTMTATFYPCGWVD